MTPTILRACGGAAALGLSIAAFAQTTGQQSADLHTALAFHANQRMSFA
jgi:hypothetical protein